MEEKEISCVDRFITEMEGYGYRFSIDVSEESSPIERDMMIVKFSLAARKRKPKGELSWREVTLQFSRQ